MVLAVIIMVVSLLLGGLSGFVLYKKAGKSKLKEAEDVAQKIIKEAETVKKEILFQAKDDIYRAREAFEKETKEKRSGLQGLEKRLVQREGNLEKRVDLLDQKEANIAKKEKTLVNQEKRLLEKENELSDLVSKQRSRLERVSGISCEEAKRLLVQSMESEARSEAAKRIKQVEGETKRVTDKIAKDIISLAIQRYASDYVSEKTISVVNLPSEEMKGRIIGREGRNIRAIEAATGVELIVDDTPEAVLLSGYNPIRREIAKISLERLINDGRIHPARVETMVEKVTEEVEGAIRETGEKAVFEVGLGQLHPELVKLLGRLKFRTSFDQNVLQHSVEVAFFTGIMAAELGLNQKQAKMAGLLHDIGKAVDHEVEGSHALIGADLVRKYGEAPEIVHAVAVHHDGEAIQSPLAVLLQAGDALSAARPGVRRETMESYIKRLKDLENIASSFSGISKSYAVQAGREIRIMVESKEVSDEEAVMLSYEIARKIEATLSYPGQIKVTVIRETRTVEYAK